VNATSKQPSVVEMFEPSQPAHLVRCRLCHERVVHHVIDMAAHARQHRLLGPDLVGLRGKGPVWAR